MSGLKLDKSLEAAQEVIGGDALDLSRLDQIFDLQRLIGPVIAYKRLLEIVIGSGDDKEVLRAIHGLPLIQEECLA